MINKEPTFFITGIEIRPLKSFHHKYVEYNLPFHNHDENSLVVTNRTFGWSHAYEEAEQWVLNNAADIAEGGTNRWAVIEGFTPGLHNYRTTIQKFFEFVGKWETDGHYEPINGWPEPLDDYYKKHHLVRVLSSIG